MNCQLVQAPTAGVMIRLHRFASNPETAKEIQDRLTNSGRTVIDLSREQVNEFAGKAFEMTGTKNRVLALSVRVAVALKKDQIKIIEKSTKLLPLHIPTIELEGGSVRCMIAGIQLTAR